MPKVYIYLTVALSCSFCCQLISWAQRNYDPNLNHFYRSRQQIQIIDESPVVTRQGSASGSGKTNAGLPGKPMPLPAAGWQSYTPTSPPGFATGLPKTNNGVPPKDTANSPSGKRAKPGALTAAAKIKGKPTQKAPTSPSGVAAYKPYNTYPSASSSAAASNNQQSSANVRGSILHWARGHHESN